MLFRRIIFYALLIGVLVGSIATLVQEWSATPIIIAAELFEEADGHHHGGHHHGDGHAHVHHSEAQAKQPWAPGEGLERTFYTWLSNVSAGIGFAVVLLAAMSLLEVTRNLRVTPTKGLIWGLCGFAAFFAVPSIGLPPEIPGTEAGALFNRQLWWSMAVICTLLCLASLFLLPIKYKAVSILWAALPFLGWAPSHPEVLFKHSDPTAVESLLALHQSFSKAAALNNIVFWLCLGIGCAWVLRNRVHRGLVVHNSGA